MILPVLLTLALFGVAALLGATLYESAVMAPNYERDVPESIATARKFLTAKTPADFFRFVAPATQLVLLASAIVAWRSPLARWPAAGAFIVLVVCDVITYTFHYPRLAILFKQPLTDDAERLRRAAREWAAGNAVRALLLFLAFLLVLNGIVRDASIRG